MRKQVGSNGDKRLAIDLFAGAGGLSQGLKEAGFKIIVANELHHDACETYRENHPDTRLIESDIKKVEPEAFLEEAEKATGEALEKGDIDLVAGGPPCEGFTPAGDKNENDPRNTLYQEYVRIVDYLRPKAFLMENVPGLTSLYNGKVLSEVKKEFNKLNYNYKIKKLRACDFGVPQIRKRVFFIGFEDGTNPKFPEPTYYPTPSMFPTPKSSSQSKLDRLPKPPTIGEALSDLATLGPGEEKTEYDLPPQTKFQERMRKNTERLYNHVATNHSNRVIDRFSRIPPGGDKNHLPERLRTKKDGRKRWHPKRLSRAVVSPDDFIHYERNRIPTVRELARLQTFPDDYVFKGQRTAGNWRRKFEYCSQTQQVGDSVPVLLAKAVGESIREKLDTT